jgi:hypothetical protein
MPRTMSMTAGFHAAPAPAAPAVPAAYGSIPYAYRPQHQYLTTMNSTMPLQMPQPLASSIPSSLGASTPSSMPLGQAAYYVPQRTGQLTGQDEQVFGQASNDWVLGQSDGRPGELQYFGGNSTSTGSEQWPPGPNNIRHP